MSSPSKTSFFSRRSSSSNKPSSSLLLQQHSKSSLPHYSLNDLSHDTIYLITSFLIPRIPQLDSDNVPSHIKQMIIISSISKQFREWSENETIQTNFWRDFLFQQLMRHNVRLSLVQVSSKDTLQFSNSQNAQHTLKINNVMEREDWMNGAFVGSSFSDAGYWDDDDEDDYFEDDIRYQHNSGDVNGLLRRGDYLSYTNGGPAATQRILLKIVMHPEKIKHMLFNISTYFHHEINAKAKKGFGHRNDAFTSRRNFGLDLL